MSLQLGIIGQPLTHSLSPGLHAQLMHQLGINGEYRKYELAASELAENLQAFAAQGLRGLNVTIPHKVSVMPLLDWISPEAQVIGAVNTIVFEEGGQFKKGYNTDVTGFVRSLPQEISVRLPESHILILGAGGSARAVVAGLIQQGTAAITLAVRDPQKSVSLLSDAEMMKQTYGVSTQMATASFYSLPGLSGFEGLVNTTPVGMWPNEAQSPLSAIELEALPTGSFVYDLIYRPLQTQLLSDAATLGLHTINGLDMLLLQGISAFELWQNQSVPETMLATLRTTLERMLSQEASQKPV